MCKPLLEHEPLPAPAWVPDDKTVESIQPLLAKVDEEFIKSWDEAELKPVAETDLLTWVRRVSLALMGTIPSIQEIRELEKQPKDSQRIWWLSHVLTDRRYADYMAERFARVYVGVEEGPFLIYRRRRFVSWLSDMFLNNLSYDQLAYKLITAKGIWTTKPEANFITVTAQNNNPDEIRLAGRFTRAFLGLRMDCMQCHDDQFGGDWKQEDFHQLASYFAGSKMSISGVMDNDKKDYKVKLHKRGEEEVLEERVPFAQELYVEKGAKRERLANWVTHKEHPSFARAFVNRVWALLYGKPLVEPIDHIPLEGPFPPSLELLSKDFIEHNFNIRRLVAAIVLSRPYKLQSYSEDDDLNISFSHYEKYAAFPMTRLRPEQVAGSILQASSLKVIDAESHILTRIIRYFQGNDFVKRYGDVGEDEFGAHGGTIPQRLLMMNGKMVSKRTEDNLLMNAAAQLSVVTTNSSLAIKTAYLSVLSRYPSEDELMYFKAMLEGAAGKGRMRSMQDLYWSLFNSTEFSWSH